MGAPAASLARPRAVRPAEHGRGRNRGPREGRIRPRRGTVAVLRPGGRLGLQVAGRPRDLPGMAQPMTRETTFWIGGFLTIGLGLALAVGLGWAGAGVEYSSAYFAVALAMVLGSFFIYVA